MTIPERSRLRLFWQLQISSWLVLMPFFTGIALVIFNDISTAMLVGIFRQIIGFGLTLGLWQVYRRWLTTNFRLSERVWQIAGWCLLAAVIDFAVAEGVRWISLMDPLTPLAQYGSAVIRFSLYLAWTAFYFVIRQEIVARETELRLARAESTNREAELLLLRAQMNPHFIFNALNTIIFEAESNPPAVVETTHAVADYLRYSLSQNAHQAPLGNELTAMSNYLRVEQASHGAHRLDWEIEASETARNALAPTALIQPLIENAMKYGMRSSTRPLRLRIYASADAALLTITVENTGDWVQHKEGDQARNSHGIGLANLQRRLVLLYGDASRFEITTPKGYVRVTIRVPFTAAPADLATLKSANPFPPTAQEPQLA